MMTNLEHLCDNLSADPSRDIDSHLLVLYSIARFLPAKLAVEIGVDDGSSTLPLLMGVYHNLGMLVSVDPAPCPRAAAAVRDAGLRDRWVFVQRRSEQFAEWWDHGMPFVPDLVFIDGDHSFEGVQSDWRIYGPTVRVGGLVLLHDALNTQEFPGIQRLIDEEIRPNPYWECCTLPYGFGLTICRKLRGDTPTSYSG